MSPSARFLLRADLRPVIGDRFQPTGFPDIGAGIYERHENGAWVDCLVVESPQSMANRLEAAGWDELTQQPVAELAGLPYVRVVRDDGSYVTSSRTEAHRLASAFIKNATLDGQKMTDVIRERLGLADDKPLAPREIAAAVFVLDPLCLVHGVFFAESAKVWPGQPKVARAVTGIIDAIEVKRAEYGGVKKDQVRHSISDTGGSTEGYGTIPYHRTEWTARRIDASFSLDRRQLRSYGLPEPATALLDAIARWEIRTLLDNPLRLRTACDLELVDTTGDDLASADDLAAEIRSGVAACGELLGTGGALDVTWAAKSKSK